MAGHSPKYSVCPDGKVIKSEYEETRQLSTHIAKYQGQWLEKKRDEDNFNLSEKIREMIDVIIMKDDVEMPEELMVSEEELKESDSALDVFITED